MDRSFRLLVGIRSVDVEDVASSSNRELVFVQASENHESRHHEDDGRVHVDIDSVVGRVDDSGRAEARTIQSAESKSGE